jgi:uncharacterized OsmC-like protein
MPAKHVKLEATQLDGFKIETRSGRHVNIVDQPVAGGGTDSGPSPLDYLFISLAGCIITIGNIIAKQRQLPVRKIEVTVEGDLDTDILMGKRSDARPGFTGIHVHTKFDADLTQEEKDALLKEIDERCPISDNLHNTSTITFSAE